MQSKLLSFLNHLVTVKAEDSDTRRRGQLLSTLILLVLASLPLLLVNNLVELLGSSSPRVMVHIVSDVTFLVLLIGLLYLNRAGHIRWASYGFLALWIIAFPSSLEIMTLDRVLLAYAVPTIAASFLISPGSSFTFALLSAVGYILAYLANPLSQVYSSLSIISLFLVAIAAWLAATNLENALTGVRRALARERAAQEEIKRLNQSLERRIAERTAQYAISEAVHSTRGLEELFYSIHSIIGKLIPAKNFYIALYDSGADILSFPYFVDECEPTPPPHKPGKGLTEYVLRTGKPLLALPEIQAELIRKGKTQQVGPPAVDWLGVPLKIGNKIIGALVVQSYTEGLRFGEEEKSILMFVSEQVAMAIERKRAEASLRRYNLELKARNKELDAFARTVAHDLKNPLNLIIGFSSVLETDYAQLAEEEIMRSLQIISKNSSKMDNIIDELLLLASLPGAAVETVPLDMASVVAEAQQRLIYMIEEHQAEISLPESWPVAVGYGPWIEEVWDNYLSNAIKYGGQPPRVELGATVQAEDCKESKVVRFWVRDNGPGLTPEERARLFTPFTQLDQASPKGHGLGLSIVKLIVEKLGGQVGVESEAGQGSTFSFTLPAHNSDV